MKVKIGGQDQDTNRMLNCPNCGAPIQGHLCEYCGTIFYDFVNMGIDQDSLIRLNLAGKLCIFKARTRTFTIEQDEPASFYADSEVYYTTTGATHLTIEMDLVPDDRGVLLTRYQEERK